MVLKQTKDAAASMIDTLSSETKRQRNLSNDNTETWGLFKSYPGSDKKSSDNLLMRFTNIQCHWGYVRFSTCQFMN